MDTPVPTDLDTRRPFSRAQARAAGISVKRLLGPGFTRVLHDRYVEASVEVTPELRALAAVELCARGSAASHHTAAVGWRLWVDPDDEVHVSVPAGAPRPKRRGVRAHVLSAGAGTVVVGGCRRTDPVTTFLDLAAHLSLVDLVVLADSILHRGLATAADLVDAADRSPGRRAVVARRAARLARAGAESPMETRLRLLVVLAGLPEPVVQHRIVDRGGREVARVDLAWPTFRVALEYDGRQHAESIAQWQRDIDRREDVDDLGWRTLVCRSPDLFVHPDRTLRRVADVLRAAGAPGVRIRGDEWRRHFPGRPAMALAA